MSYQQCSGPIGLGPVATVSVEFCDLGCGSSTHRLAKIDLHKQKSQMKENSEQYDNECSITVGALGHKSQI